MGNASNAAESYRQRRNPVENEADWTLSDGTFFDYEVVTTSSNRQALAESFARDITADALGRLEPHVAQRVLHYVLDFMDADEPLASWHPAWKMREYYEIFDALYGRDSTQDREPGEVVDFVHGQIKKLGRQYQFKDGPAVNKFVRENAFLTELLLEAREKIREYFGEDVSAALDVVKERDAKSSGRLFVFILTTLRPKEAVARLDALDNDWWLAALAKAQGKVTIDIDYG